MKIIKSLTRIFISQSELDETIKFYENIFNEKCSMKFDYVEINLKLAMVGSILLLAGTEKDLEIFKKTKITFLVDSVKEYYYHFLSEKITILENPVDVPRKGIKMRVQHPDGIIVEYVEHTK